MEQPAQFKPSPKHCLEAGKGKGEKQRRKAASKAGAAAVERACPLSKVGTSESGGGYLVVSRDSGYIMSPLNRRGAVWNPRKQQSVWRER